MKKGKLIVSTALTFALAAGMVAGAADQTAKATTSKVLVDGKEISGRYRITSSPERVGKTPIGENVTGYVNKTDLK